MRTQRSRAARGRKDEGSGVLEGGRITRRVSITARGPVVSRRSAICRRTAFVAVVVVVTAGILCLSACGGSSPAKPKETFKHAQAALVKPYTALLNAAGGGGDPIAATDRLIFAIHQHEPALGAKETRRSFSDTAYALKRLGVCPECVQKLQDQAAKVGG